MLPDSKYESLSNSVLAWKKSQKLGRFDPEALSPRDLMARQAEKDGNQLVNRGISFFLSFFP